MTYTLSSTHAAILEQLEEMRGERAGIDQMFYTCITEGESVDAIESRGPGRRTHPTRLGLSRLEGESR